MSEPITCRVCYGSEHKCEILIEPCHCKGTVAKVHRQCLEKWLNFNGSQACELCLFKFDVTAKRRYRLFESISIWIQLPLRRQMLLQDSLFFGSITLISVLMIGLIIFGLQSAQIDPKFGKFVSDLYFVSLFLVAFLWIIILTLAVLLFFNLQIDPWLQWWRSTKRISLIKTVTDIWTKQLCVNNSNKAKFYKKIIDFEFLNATTPRRVNLGLACILLFFLLPNEVYIVA